MKRTGGAIVVRALEDEEIPFAFGIPGTHNIELYDALATSTSRAPRSWRMGSGGPRGAWRA